MRKGFKMLICTIAMMICNQSIAQGVEMAEGMRAEGKIYVVVAIVLLILGAIFLYLTRLDRKLKKLESERKSEGE